MGVATNVKNKDLYSLSPVQITELAVQIIKGQLCKLQVNELKMLYKIQ